MSFSLIKLVFLFFVVLNFCLPFDQAHGVELPQEHKLDIINVDESKEGGQAPADRIDLKVEDPGEKGVQLEDLLLDKNSDFWKQVWKEQFSLHYGVLANEWKEKFSLHYAALTNDLPSDTQAHVNKSFQLLEQELDKNEMEFLDRRRLTLLMKAEIESSGLTKKLEAVTQRTVLDQLEIRKQTLDRDLDALLADARKRNESSFLTTGVISLLTLPIIIPISVVYGPGWLPPITSLGSVGIYFLAVRSAYCYYDRKSLRQLDCTLAKVSKAMESAQICDPDVKALLENGPAKNEILERDEIKKDLEKLYFINDPVLQPILEKLSSPAMVPNISPGG